MTPTRFCTYLADTLHSQTLHHHLRYKVYCERKHFEEGTADGSLPQERDDYDSFASRFLIKDETRDRWIGTARLVTNEHDVLPAQTLGAIDRRYAHVLETQPSAEVSRLAAVSVYRSVRCTSELLRSVIVGTVGHSQEHGIEWLVFLICPGLARVLQKLGIPMEACGPEIDHRGIRQAYRSHIASGIGLLPWTRCLREGVTGYELFSAHSVPTMENAA
jgi:N-acyl-L-homoserine lactone synthetase